MLTRAASPSSASTSSGWKLSVTRLLPHLLGEIGDEHLNLRFSAWLGSEFGVQNHGHVRLPIMFDPSAPDCTSYPVKRAARPQAFASRSRNDTGKRRKA